MARAAPWCSGGTPDARGNMKITAIETLCADAGWRTFSFLKVSTDAGITGWSEFADSESYGSPGVAAVITTMAPIIIGQDPRPTERVVSTLHVLTQHAALGGLTHLAIAAIENALLDIKGKDLGVPVYALFGGPVRERLPTYWSHAGTYRVRNAALLGVAELRSYDDLARHAEQIRSLGFKALKTNLMPLVAGRLAGFAPGFGRGTGWPELNWDHAAVRAAADTMAALRAGAGPEMGLMLDLNFHFKTEGFSRVAQAVAPYNLTWLEFDIHDPTALRLIRDRAPCPIASLETLCHRREFKPYFEAYAADVAIIDVIRNGLAESLKIAAMAEVYGVNVAPHNYYGPLSSAISAHFCAVVPNFRIMETDIDGVPWRDEFVSAAPVIENGEMVLPSGPGWGIVINEAAVRARPPRN
ncbi:MAG: mandelate racemase/muconate lactonizing enzyme family protein [Devosia sp.]|nr:mandelate racemase/muconate lactonizing enzyme family protein [Devosia sp.]